MLSDFKKQVRHALIDHDMSITDLASELDLSVSYVHEILSGSRKSEVQKDRIKEILGISDAEDDEEQDDS